MWLTLAILTMAALTATANADPGDDSGLCSDGIDADHPSGGPRAQSGRRSRADHDADPDDDAGGIRTARLVSDTGDTASVRSSAYEAEVSFTDSGWVTIHTIGGPEPAPTSQTRSHDDASSDLQSATVLSFRQQGGTATGDLQTEPLLTFPLQGDIAAAHAADDAPRPILVGHSWRRIGEAEDLTVEYQDGSGTRTVRLTFHHDFIAYGVALSGASGYANSVVYLRTQGAAAVASGAFEELASWTPDVYDILLPDRGTSRLTIGSRTPAPGESYTRGYSAGSPLVAPYLAALRSGNRWLGIGTQEVPSADFGLDISVDRASVSAAFEGAGGEGLPAKREFPTIGIYFGRNPGEILAAYRRSLHPETSDAGDRAAWWGDPIYCTWGDQAYQSRMSEGTLAESSGPQYASEEYVERFLAVAERHRLPLKTIVLDLGWAEGYGDFRPSPRRFKDLRGYIDRLHARGLRVLLWMPMYEATGDIFNPDRTVSEVAEKHADWIAKDREGRSLDRFDYTVPAVRDYIRGRIRYMLGGAADELNADGLKIDFMDRVPPVDSTAFFDANWGVGERMTLQVLQLIYRAAKSAKSDAMIDSSFINPLFQPWQTVIRLNDDVSNAPDTYWDRARAAAQSGVRLIEGDDWWAMERYFVPLTLAKAAWGVPSLYAIQYRGVLGTAGPITGVAGIPSGGYPAGISDLAYLQVRSILGVYLHAPADASQTPSVDPQRRAASRTYSEGPLRGLPAAETANFATALVTYTEESAFAMTLVPGRLAIKIPAGLRAASVHEVDFDGRERRVAGSRSDGSLAFNAHSAESGVDRYVVRFGPSQA